MGGSLICYLSLFPRCFLYFISVIFFSLITMCLGVFLLGFILPGTPCTSCTWLTISLPMFRKFSAISSSNIFSDSFSLLSPSGTLIIQMFSSVQFSHSVVSDSLRPHESQHARPPCPLPTPRVNTNSYASSQWSHPAISSSAVPFSCPQFLPASGSFPMSQLFSWGGQSIGVSALASGLISFRMDWLDLLSVQGTLKNLLQHHSSKASILRLSAFFTVQLSHPYMTTGRTIALTRWTLLAK